MSQNPRVLPKRIADSIRRYGSSDEDPRELMLRLYHTNPRRFIKWLNRLTIGGVVTLTDELVVGGGLHGTTYVVNRSLWNGIVYDQSIALSSIFGQSAVPAFYLNSRNRPEGDLRKPSSPGPLNSIVGGWFQPSEFNLLEYQAQADLAYAIRLNLANATALATNVRVTKIERCDKRESPYTYKVMWEYVQRTDSLAPDGGVTYTNRIVLAPGLGQDRMPIRRSSRVLSFTDFLRRINTTQAAFNMFQSPFRDFKRVAIVGAGDSGKVVAEALLGLGPQIGFSNAADDFLERLVWVGQENRTKEQWESCERSRYIGLGRSFPRQKDPNYYYRVQPEPGRAVRAVTSSKSVRLYWTGPDGPKDERFDYVIVCAGFENRVDSELCSDFTAGTSVVRRDGQAVARQYLYEQIYVVGPAAELELEDGEITPKIDIPENITSAFRYVEKTAAFAKSDIIQLRGLSIGGLEFKIPDLQGRAI